MWTKALAVTGVATGVLVYWLWVPLPDDMDQKTTLRIAGAVFKIINLTNLLGLSRFGFKHRFEPMRAMAQKAPKPDPESDPELMISDKIAAGIPVRVFRPKSATTPSPAVIHYHSGGWTLGSIDQEDGMCRYIAKNANIVVISVEYRLSPEHPFPAPLEDCLTATVHVLTKGNQWGVDTRKVGLIGQSAGGNLAITVAMRLQEPEFQKLPPLLYQVMLNPCLQGLDFGLPSFVDNNPVAGSVLTSELMAAFYLSYAGIHSDDDTVRQVVRNQHVTEIKRKQWKKFIHADLLTSGKAPGKYSSISGSVNETLAHMAEPVFLNYLVSPVLAPESKLTLLPPAMTVASHYDVVRDDALLYDQRLRQAGVQVTSHMLERGHHLAMVISHGGEPPTPDSLDAWERVLKFVRERNGL